jgi:hypothetical protein
MGDIKLFRWGTGDPEVTLRSLDGAKPLIQRSYEAS